MDLNSVPFDAVVVVQSLSHVQLFATPWTAAIQASLSLLPLWVCSKSCPLSQWCYLTISSSAVLFFFHLQSFPASWSIPMSRLFASGGQSTGASASASVLPMNIQGWFLLGLTGLIPLKFKNSQEFSPTPQFESINSSVLSLLYGPTFTSIHDYWKDHSFDSTDLCQQSDVRDPYSFLKETQLTTYFMFHKFMTIMTIRLPVFCSFCLG